MSEVVDERAETFRELGVFARLDLPPDSRYLVLARTFARDVVVCAGFASDVAEDVKLAISELATNAVKAHRAAAIDEPIRIAAERVGDVLRLTVSDRGAGFAEGRETAARADATAGFGIVVVRSLFPDLVIEHPPGGGTDVSFAIHAE